jgi:hypothetical protein
MTNFIFKDSVIFATNLSFDFFGTFFGDSDLSNFKTLFRGSDLLMAETHFLRGKFYPFPTERLPEEKAAKRGRNTDTNRLKSLKFLDSLNYAKMSVESMGEIIGIPKLEKPSFLGQNPESEQEWEYLKEYNLRDSEITYHFMKFLISSFEHLGATFKDTIASTSMSLFRNKYLIDTYYQPKKEILLKQLLSYYGGRTEAFKRGYFENCNYYDFNSLYPSVMHDFEYPDPNSIRITTMPKEKYIKDKEGCSNVEIFVPHDLHHPVLPFRTDEGRVIFPTGTISGWYCHNEIREALANGCKIKSIREIIYYDKTCRPFQNFTSELYNYRLELKKQKSPMELVVKIILNSLYGKFGQKFDGRENYIHRSALDENVLNNSTTIEPIDEFYRVVVKEGNPAPFCVPIWASYVAAYGRIKLHRAIKETDPIYCDTDSLMTYKTLPESNELGHLKLEMHIKEGIVVRPKFYALVSEEKIKGSDEHVKIKGLGRRLTYLEFMGLMNHPIVFYDKFCKFKEALRHNFIPNEIIETHKEFSLEDEKRLWPYPFDHDNFQNSHPIDIDTHVFSYQKKKFSDFEASQFKKLEREIILSDAFDIASVGHDISPEEFIENEKYFYNE